MQLAKAAGVESLSNININVQEATNLKGSLIASMDAEGNDNGELNLNTNTLTVSSLNDTVNSKSISGGMNAGGELDEAKASNVSVNFSNDTQNSKTKVLATLGLGNINIGNTEDSDTKMLNRDIENNEVDIYDVESHKGLSVELDTNMLTEKGRQKIAEDLLKSDMIVNTIELIATTDRVGVEDFFSETDKTHKTYEAVKTKIATDPELAKQLNSDNLTPSQKEEMLDEITGAVMVKLGYSENSNVLISTDATGQDSKEIKGFISTETDDSYINDKNNNSNKDLVTTAGHEASSYIDIQEGMDITQNRDDNNLYSDNFGENLASYTNFALDVTGQGSMATGNTHNSGQVTSTPSVFNDNTFAVNNAEFAGLDKEAGDNFGLAGGTVSVGLDLTIQGLEYFYGNRTELDKESLAISFGAGFVGAGLASKVQKLGTISKFGAETAIDASVSATSQYLKTGKVEGENLMVDVGFGKVGGIAGSKMGQNIKNSDYMKQVDTVIDRQTRKVNNPKQTNQSRIDARQRVLDEVVNYKNKKIESATTRTAIVSSGVGSSVSNIIVDMDDSDDK